VIELLRRNPLIAGLAVACAVLAAIVVFEIVSGTGASTHAAARKAAPAEQKLLPALAATSLEQVYPETVNRPLWIPTRRPAPPAAVAQASFERGKYILQGVTIVGDNRIALLKEKASGRIYRIEKGRDLNGLQVAEVEPERVTLALGAEREVVELRVQRPGAPGPGQPGAAAPPPAYAPGPFAPAGGAQGAPPAVPPPGSPPPVMPAGMTSPISQQTQPGPLPPTGSPQNPAGGSNPSAAAVPQPATTAPMTPEELLARRRARRNQSP
jgi:hypothetical protein